jgi:hypothetical protein
MDLVCGPTAAVAQLMCDDGVLHCVVRPPRPGHKVIDRRHSFDRLLAIETQPVRRSVRSCRNGEGKATRSAPNRWRRRSSSITASLFRSATMRIQCSSTRGRRSGASRTSWSPAPSRSRILAPPRSPGSRRGGGWRGPRLGAASAGHGEPARADERASAAGMASSWADLLAAAVAHFDVHGPGDCPVRGRAGALNDK